MKKSLLFCLALLFTGTCFAKTYKIKVSNYQFSPATVNAKVGDTILFIWQEGFHTTTSLTIPAKAKPWDHQLNSSSKRFKYVLKKTGTYNFHCSFHSIMTGQIIVSNTLNAEFSDISISAENEKTILSWNLNNIKNVSYFSVQRSIDGKNFTEVAKLKASELNMYKYVDEAPAANKYLYYQVALTDQDGNTQLSDIKMFTNAQNIAKLITSLSPNPVTGPGHLMLQFNADAEGKMLVQLFTQSGKLVKQTEMQANKGLNNGHFHLGELTPGSYYILCTMGNKTEKHVIVYQ